MSAARSRIARKVVVRARPNKRRAVRRAGSSACGSILLCRAARLRRTPPTADDAAAPAPFMAPLLELANLPDADVVALAQQGRETAFRELIRRYERPVFSLIFRMVRDRETAEDLSQETFIKVLN